MTLSPLAVNSKAKETFLTLEERFNKKHNFKYDYSQAVYLNNTTKLNIICPIHGLFQQASANHLKSGCLKCSGRYLHTTEEFIEKAKKVHGNRYIYSSSVYLKNSKNVTITCRVHGDFPQIARNHLNGAGCPKCAIVRVARFHRKSTEQFKADAKVVHGDRYDYTNTVYIRDKDKVAIKCEVHGIFEQTASDHLQGKGCQKCSEITLGWGRERYKDKQAIFYVLKLTDNLFKVGVTSQKTVHSRYSGDKKYPVHFQTLFTEGSEAWDLELYTLQQLKKYKYKGSEVFFEHTQNTEILTINPTNKIKEFIMNLNLTSQYKEGSHGN